jgi:heme O synthase-like polyprenyltransferase
LTLLVCLTSAAGFGLAPTDPVAGVNWAMLGVSTAGVALISAAANTVNQMLEVKDCL